MTVDNDNIASQGLYIWQTDNLLTATAKLNGHWQFPETQPASGHKIASHRIATDTRAIKAGDVFLALSGDNFDGHDYIAAAADKGAIAAIVSRPISTSIPQLIVSDTRLALGQLATYRRQQHQELTIIALTGSSGKTTCKEMLGSIFSRLAPTLITRGNLNNDLGVPMMLLELSDQHRYAIMELGANHIGEIAYTTEMVRPDVACILNVGTAHLGEFGSRQNICQAKAEIYHTLTAQQTAIVPDQDDFASELRRIASKQTPNVLGFGSTDVWASEMSVESEGSKFNLHIGDDIQQVSLPLAGEHNISNALAAAACAHALKVDIGDIVIGLEQARPAKGRLVSQMFGIHKLIDDTYNANPSSVRAAAEVLAVQTGTKVMVLGDIAELGDAAISEHQSLGRSIADTDIDSLLCVGEYAAYSAASAQEHGGICARAFANKDSLLQHLQQYLQAQQTKPCTVLFKGSRSMEMETLIDTLVKE